MRVSDSQELPSPWRELLGELDEALSEPVELHCIGGFVIGLLYKFPRPTADVDYISAIPRDQIKELVRLAGRESRLARKHKVYLQHVAIATMTEDYESRLTEMFRGRFKKLKIFAPDPYDLALSKLERNSPKDQEDVEYLARTAPLRPEVLQERYERELRPNLMARQSWHDGSLKMWLGAYFSKAGPGEHTK
jgi:hypothetical protein